MAITAALNIVVPINSTKDVEIGNFLTQATISGGVVPYTAVFSGDGSVTDGNRLHGYLKISSVSTNSLGPTNTLRFTPDGHRTLEGSANTVTYSITVYDYSYDELNYVPIYISYVNALSVTASRTSVTGNINRWIDSITLTTDSGFGNITWEANNLPPGITFDSSLKRISGAPTTAGNWQSHIIVRDESGKTASVAINFSFTIATLSIINSTNDTYNVGVSTSKQFNASGGVSPFTWDVSSLPSFLTWSSTGGQLIISGTPSSVGTWNATINVSDSLGDTASRAVVINVTYPSLLATLDDLYKTRAYVGDTYNNSCSATGGVPPYTWSASGLPAGLSISSSGVITGTFISPTPERVVVYTVTDANNQTATVSTTLTVFENAPSIGGIIGYTVGSSAGSTYSHSFTVSGGTSPYTWSASGLPTGLSINSSTGVVSGTFSSVYSGTAVITVTDAVGQTDTTSVSFSIAAAYTPTPTITNGPSSTVVGSVDDSYSYDFNVTSGTSPYTWSASGLPTGLSINSSTGLLSGTFSSAGNSTASVTVTDANGKTASKSVVFSITQVSTPQTPPTIVSGFVTYNGIVGLGLGGTDFPVGDAYSCAFAASDGTPPYTWSAIGLPTGLSINSSTGLLSGTFSLAGTFSATVTVTDANSLSANAVGTYIVVAAQVSTPSISNAPQSTISGVKNAGFTYDFNVAGGTSPYTWSAAGLPAGLSINASTGVVSGTFSSVYSGTATITVSDANSQADSKSVSFSVTDTSVLFPVVSVTNSVSAKVNSNVNSYICSVSSGVPPYTWSATGVPPGLTFDTTSLLLSGVPSTIGTYQIVITVTDSSGKTATGTCSFLVIDLTAPTISDYGTSRDGHTYWPIPTTETGKVGDFYSFTFKIGSLNDGTFPHSWSATGLPPGLSIFSGEHGYVSGTYSSPGAFTTTVTLTSANGLSDSHTFSFNISGTQASATNIVCNTTDITREVGDSCYIHLGISSSASPFTWTATGLPPGVSLITPASFPNERAIEGTFTTVGSYRTVVQVTDDNAQNDVHEIFFTITQTGSSLTTRADTFTLDNRAGETAIDVTANDYGTGLSVVSITTPRNGGTARVSGGVIYYTPKDQDEAYVDGFYYTAVDANSASSEAEVVITVNGYVPPLTYAANDGSITVYKNVKHDTGDAVRLFVSGSTTGWVIVSITQPSHGVASLSGTGLAYTPTAEYAGDDSLTVLLRDPGNVEHTVALDITVIEPSTLSITPVGDVSLVITDVYSGTLFTVSGGVVPFRTCELVITPFSDPAYQPMTIDLPSTQEVGGSWIITADGLPYWSNFDFIGNPFIFNSGGVFFERAGYYTMELRLLDGSPAPGVSASATVKFIVYDRDGSAPDPTADPDLPAGTAVIQGTLRLDTSDGAFAARKVYLYDYTTGNKVDETTSDGVTGEWEFTMVAPGEYFVVGVAQGDDLNVPRDFDALGVITITE